MTQTEFLLNTLEYYTTDVNRRCINEYGGCSYSPEKVGKEDVSAGCAIGRWLEPELKIELDNVYGTSVCNQGVFDSLPKFMKDLSKFFLVRVQKLHDERNFWSSKGLTNKGKMYLSEVIKEFKLDKNLFTKY